ncbi:MAG: helix-turn-helix domain-containing protein [Acidobacteriaceae bacterium]|nr:helix-turn-helix domain-containing protein [Acidobacteriaceae bacterium]
MSLQPNVFPIRNPVQLGPGARPESQRIVSARMPDVLLGPSAAIAHVWSQIRRVAPYFRTALVTGERGSGTEATAKALHSLSPLAGKALVSMSPSDAEARLTGPTLPKLHGHVVFFQDVDCLSAAAQQGLLRLLRARRPNQVTIIASASGELRPLVSAGGFSPVLANALSALHLIMPPLRARREDIPALATQLLAFEALSLHRDLPEMSQEFLLALTQEDWPGNLDQMQAVLRRFLERHPDTAPTVSHLRPLLEATQPAPVQPVEPVRLLTLDQVIYEHIRSVLLRCNGNKLRAAEILGISRSTLYRMLDAHSVHKSEKDDLPLAV